MKEIPLTQGQFAIVDDADFEWLNQWKWSAWKNGLNFYAARGIRKGDRTIQILMHRLILGLQKSDKRETDHINHNGLDNCRCNLRAVSKNQNMWNMKNVKGCDWQKKRKKWRSRICVYNKYIHLGYFLTEQEAHQAYLDAKKQYHSI